MPPLTRQQAVWNREVVAGQQQEIRRLESELARAERERDEARAALGNIGLRLAGLFEQRESLLVEVALVRFACSYCRHEFSGEPGPRDVKIRCTRCRKFSPIAEARLERRELQPLDDLLVDSHPSTLARLLTDYLAGTAVMRPACSDCGELREDCACCTVCGQRECSASRHAGELLAEAIGDSCDD
jgi:hypothetical protein